jgi:Zn-dependent protease
MFSTETIINLFYMLPSILIALAFHEYCHGLASTLLGDDIPRLQGRLSLNPIRHLDPWGTIFMIITSIGGAGFGWAKPVMVNPNRYKCNRKLGMLIVALAGPLANVFLALVGAYLCRLITSGLIPYNEYFHLFFYLFVCVNISLAAFNILPIPPLDGSKVLAIILPNKYANMVYSASQYFIIILLLLSFTGLLGYIMNPIINGLFTFVNFVTYLF